MSNRTVVSQVFVPGGDQIPAPDFAGPEERIRTATRGI
jgi:hypothetical protein